MIRMILGFLVLAGLFLGSASPGNAGEIELADGSVVNGEITSLRDGIYTIRTESLGTLLVDESRVRTIRLGSGRQAASKTPPSFPAANSASPLPGMDAMKLRIMNDEEMMQSILALQNDPEIMKLLQDPAILQALMSGDVNTLLADPRFMKLMDHPGLRKIQQDMAR